jgi:hypothetical protein
MSARPSVPNKKRDSRLTDELLAPHGRDGTKTAHVDEQIEPDGPKSVIGRDIALVDAYHMKIRSGSNGNALRRK